MLFVIRSLLVLFLFFSKWALSTLVGNHTEDISDHSNNATTLKDDNGSFSAETNIIVELNLNEESEANELLKGDDIKDNIVDFPRELNIVPRQNIQEFVLWVTETVGKFLTSNWQLAIDMSHLASKIWVRIREGNCKEIHGQMGGLWYRYWTSDKKCESIPDQKTISEAIHAVLQKLKGDLVENVYCITMSHGGIPNGTLLIGTTPDAMTASCEDIFKGNYEVDNGSLE